MLIMLLTLKIITEIHEIIFHNLIIELDQFFLRLGSEYLQSLLKVNLLIMILVILYRVTNLWVYTSYMINIYIYIYRVDS